MDEEEIDSSDDGSSVIDAEALGFGSPEEISAKRREAETQYKDESSDEDDGSSVIDAEALGFGSTEEKSAKAKEVEAQSKDENSDDDDGSSVMDAEALGLEMEEGITSEAAQSKEERANNDPNIKLCFGATIRTLNSRTRPEESFTVVRNGQKTSSKSILRKGRKDVKLVDCSGKRYKGTFINHNISGKKLVDCVAVWNKKKACYILEIVDCTVSNLNQMHT